MAETSGVVWEGAEGGRSGGSTRFLPPTDVAAAILDRLRLLGQRCDLPGSPAAPTAV